MASSHMGTGSLIMPPPLVSRCSSGHVCAQAMQRSGLAACPPTHPMRVQTSYLWCDPEEGYLLFNLFVEVPPSQQPYLLKACGQRRGGCACGPQVSGLPVSVRRWTCTVANLRGVGDPATLRLCALGGVGFKLLTLYSLLVGSGGWGVGGQSLKPLIYFSSCVCVIPVCVGTVDRVFFQFKSEMSGNHIFLYRYFN